MPTADAPGPPVRDETLPPRGRTAVPVDRRQTVRVIDVIDATTGHVLLSDRCHALMSITADTSGRHDLLARVTTPG